MWSKVCSVLLGAVLLLTGTWYGDAGAGAAELTVSAEAAIVMNAGTGEILYEKNPDRERAIASITKIMTALLALEDAGGTEREITFTEEMIAEGSSLSLQVGEVLTVGELVKGMMMVSGNDAANALAVGLAGSIERFSDRMNERAGRIGMTHTHFVTPSGLDDEQHYSTARDMALLCREAMQNERFAAVVSQKECEISYVRPAGKHQNCINHNRLLSVCEGCTGIKTGYTKKAGRTLTSCIERDGVRLISVTLNDGDDWNDHQKMAEEGFAKLKRVTLTIEPFAVPVAGGTADSMMVSQEGDCTAALLKENADRVTKKLFLPHFLYAPVEQGVRVGEVCYYLDGQKIAAAPLRAEAAVDYEEI